MTQPDGAHLRGQLLSATTAERVQALHQLTLWAAEVADPALQRDLDAFVARGLPYFAPDSLGYQAWVAKATALTERVVSAPRRTAGTAVSSGLARGPRPERLRVARAVACG